MATCLATVLNSSTFTLTHTLALTDKSSRSLWTRAPRLRQSHVKATVEELVAVIISTLGMTLIRVQPSIRTSATRSRDVVAPQTPSAASIKLIWKARLTRASWYKIRSTSVMDSMSAMMPFSLFSDVSQERPTCSMIRQLMEYWDLELKLILLHLSWLT